MMILDLGSAVCIVSADYPSLTCVPKTFSGNIVWPSFLDDQLTGGHKLFDECQPSEFDRTLYTISY